MTGKGYRPADRSCYGRSDAPPRWALEIVYIGSGVVLPVAGAADGVRSPAFGPDSLRPATLTLRNYEYVAFGYQLTQQAILNSLYLAFVGATLGVMLALLQAYYLNRGNRKGPHHWSTRACRCRSAFPASSSGSASSSSRSARRSTAR